MSTKKTIESYFDALRADEDWQSRFAEEVVFTNHAVPSRTVTGRDGFLESTSGFYRMIHAVELQDLLVDGARACALIRYRLQPPGGEPFSSEVAEVFTVEDGEISAFSIFFDSAAFPP